MVNVLADKGLMGMEQLTNSTRLRNCVASSLDSLPHGRISLAHLSLFSGSFGITAAAAVLGVSEAEAKSQLLGLWSRRLISAEQEQPDQQYSLHLFIRELAAEGLKSQQHYILAQQRYIQHFLLVWRSAEADTTEALQHLQRQRHDVAKAVKLLAEWDQPLNVCQACCDLGIIALDSLDVIRLKTPTVTAALQQLLHWVPKCVSPETILAAREQLAYMQSGDVTSCVAAKKELLDILQQRGGTAGPDSYSLVLCLEGLANTAVVLGNSGRLSMHEANKDCDNWRSQLVNMLRVTKGLQSPQYLRAAAWFAYGLTDQDGSSRQLRVLWKTAASELGSTHPATIAIQTQFATNLSSASHEALISGATHLRAYLHAPFTERQASPEDVVCAWLRQHLLQCETLGDLDNDIVFAQLSLGTMLTRCSAPTRQQEGLDMIAKAIQGLQLLWGRDDEYVLDAMLDKQVTALQRLWQLDDALEVVDRAWELSKDGFGENSAYKACCMQSKAKLLQLKGDLATAEEALKDAEQHLRATHVSESLDVEVTLARSGVYLETAEIFTLQGR